MTAPTQIQIVAEPATSARARAAVLAYYRELAEIFPTGFDPEASVPVDYDLLQPPQGQFLILQDADSAADATDKEALGCGALRNDGDGTGEIKRMWIAPALRGQGWGGRLLEALEDEAKALGITTVRLDTARYLDTAIELYRRHGYEEIEPYNDNAYAHHWFAKTLAGPSS